MRARPARSSDQPYRAERTTGGLSLIRCTAARAAPLLGLALAFIGACGDLPSLEGTRCPKPQSACGDELNCVGGVCLSLRGGPLLCETNAACQTADPRRPFCVGTDNDKLGDGASYRDNFCASCGSDADCDGAVCVEGEGNWFCIGCLKGTDCDTGRCVQNVCRTCKSDAQCASLHCEDGRCTPAPGRRER